MKPVLALFALLAAVASIVLMAFGSWYTVNERQRGVMLRNGAIVGVAGPGFGLKWPLVDSVVDVSVETHIETFKELQAYSRDQQPAEVRVSVNYRVKASAVAELYSQFGSRQGFVDRILRPKVYEEFKSVFGQYNAVTAIQDRARLNAEIRQAVIRAVSGPVEVEAVQIENIDFSDAYEKSIEQRMLAEVEVQKLRQNAEREKVQAEIRVTQATAEANAARQSAMGQADAIRMRGEAEAAAINARGRALRENAALIELEAVQKWDGKLPTSQIPGAALPFITVK